MINSFKAKLWMKFFPSQFLAKAPVFAGGNAQGTAIPVGQWGVTWSHPAGSPSNSLQWEIERVGANKSFLH